MTPSASATQRLAEGVRSTRKARGLTQRALAELAGVSRMTIISVERSTVNVTLTTLDALATALKVDVQELLRPPR